MDIDYDHAHESAVTSIDIEASPDQVWQAITTDAGFAAWMGEGSHIDSEVGAGVTAVDLVTGERKIGVVSHVDAGQRLGYLWWTEADPELVSAVAITLEPCDVGTRVTVTESRPTSMSAGGPAACASFAGSAWIWRTALLVLAAQAALPSAVGGRDR